MGKKKILPQQLVFSAHPGAMTAPSANRLSEGEPSPPALLGAIDAFNTVTFEQIAFALSVSVLVADAPIDLTRRDHQANAFYATVITSRAIVLSNR